MNQKVIDLFWKNIIKGEDSGRCWHWTGELGRRDTPLIRVYIDGVRKEFYPRQISLQLHNKPLYKRVESTCKNKLCLNPNHLASGDEARFWSKVMKLNESNGGCWIWIASERHGGYGAFSVYENGKVIHMPASRYSFELRFGFRPSSTSFVCHKCDQPRCVNPDHLFLGSTQDNTRDRDQKGRGAHPKGELNAMAKLTENQVREIRELIKSGNLTHGEIAALYKVGRYPIYSIAIGKSWKHVI